MTKPFDRVELQARLQVGIRVVNLQMALVDRIRELEESRAREHDLRTLMPICSYCKKIRDDRNYWQMLDRYMSRARLRVHPRRLPRLHGVAAGQLRKHEA